MGGGKGFFGHQRETFPNVGVRKPPQQESRGGGRFNGDVVIISDGRSFIYRAPLPLGGDG